MAPKARHSGVGRQDRPAPNAHGRVNVGVDAFAATVEGDAGVECVPHVTQIEGVDVSASDQNAKRRLSSRKRDPSEDALIDRRGSKRRETTKGARGGAITVGTSTVTGAAAPRSRLMSMTL